ncbi:hypothetical protein C4561_04105 [candidate division WWE3 bacterium]|jgi:tetratricopeptide (TPR) repeat protein|uniref:Uncharacterized protein n=1 Tax=candidate division WWE3 bacterium TaxID=2053526 RepID=A0A3A4ZCF1_UNCKA|nr:MAG: hypothetical protein C4561_04105 [candidate division WWE3 bacterium]
MKKLLLTMLVMFVGFYMIKYFSSVYSADVAFEEGQKYMSAGDYETALLKANKSIRLNPMEPNYYRGRAKVYLAYLVEVNNRDSQKILKQAALEDLKTAYSLNPHNLVTIRNSIPLYYFLAAEDLTRPGNEDNVDEEFLPETIYFYKLVKDISPDDVGVYVLLAKYEKRLGLFEAYQESVEKVRELRPDLLEWHESFK